MAASITINHKLTTADGCKIMLADVTFDSSYPTGGETLTAANFSVGAIKALTGGMNGGYVPEWDATNGKLLAFEAGADAAPLDEVANTTDLSAVVFPVIVFGDPLT